MGGRAWRRCLLSRPDVLRVTRAQDLTRRQTRALLFSNSFSVRFSSRCAQRIIFYYFFVFFLHSSFVEAFAYLSNSFFRSVGFACRIFHFSRFRCGLGLPSRTSPVCLVAQAWWCERGGPRSRTG